MRRVRTHIRDVVDQNFVNHTIALIAACALIGGFLAAGALFGDRGTLIAWFVLGPFVLRIGSPEVFTGRWILALVASAFLGLAMLGGIKAYEIMRGPEPVSVLVVPANSADSI